MQLIQSSRKRIAAWTLGVASLLLAPSTAATICVAFDNGCGTKLVLTEYQGDDVFCLLGFPVAQIDARAACQGLITGPVRVFRCGVTNTPFSFSGGSVTHTVGTSTNWENVLNGACGDVTYSAN